MERLQQKSSLQTVEKKLPPGWKLCFSSTRNKPYYFHSNTNHAQWHFPSESTECKKRKLHAEKGDSGKKGKSLPQIKGTAAEAAKHYNILKRSLETRPDSSLFHMRAFQNWVKATQISEINPAQGLSKANYPEGEYRYLNHGLKGTPPLRVLDLACGKGGDLGKWVLHGRGISNYVGIDVADGSLVEAAERARKKKRKLNNCTFICADLGCDVPGNQQQELLSWSLQKDANGELLKPKLSLARGGGLSAENKFDVVSIQFAIHYMMSSKKRARHFFRTVSKLLDVGGNFIATTIDARVVMEHMMNLGINWHDDQYQKEEKVVISIGNFSCQIEFDRDAAKKILFLQTAYDKEGNAIIDDNLFGLQYKFLLVEGCNHAAGVGNAVNLVEYLSPVPVLESLAHEVGIELVSCENFHEFYSNRLLSTDRGNPYRDITSHHNTLCNMKVLNRNGTTSKDEWQISRMYVALKFVKVRDAF